MVVEVDDTRHSVCESKRYSHGRERGTEPKMDTQAHIVIPSISPDMKLRKERPLYVNKKSAYHRAVLAT